MKKRMNLTAILAVVMVAMSATWLTSCTADDEYGDFSYGTLAKGMFTRGGEPYNSANGGESEFGDENYFYIPDALLGTSGCGYKSIAYALKNQYSEDSIKKAMKRFDDNVEFFPPEKLGDAINALTNKTVNHDTGSNCENNVSIGDIVCVGTKDINGYATKCGHATVVTSIEKRLHYTLINCYDGCKFDTYELRYVYHTSQL